jgi:hypothetical protein
MRNWRSISIKERAVSGLFGVIELWLSGGTERASFPRRKKNSYEANSFDRQLSPEVGSRERSVAGAECHSIVV